MSNDLPEEPLDDSSLLRGITDPALKPITLDDLRGWTAPELMVLTCVRGARRAVTVDWVVKASGYNLATVEQALDALIADGWVGRLVAKFTAL